MNLAQLLVRSARAFPRAPALAHGERLLYDYAEFARRAAALAGSLTRARRLSPGERVALFMDNSPAYLEALYGIWWAGLAAVPINAKLHAREAEYILQASEARLCFVDTAHGDALRGVSAPALIDVGSEDYAGLLRADPVEPAAVESHALAWLFYTSGTTGRPKGAMLSHRNFLTMMSCYHLDVDDVAPADFALYAAPMSHGAGCYNFLFVQRAALHVVPERGFEPAEILTLARRYARDREARRAIAGGSGLSMFAAPTMVKRLVDYVQQSGDESRGIKTIVYGGGPMYLEDIKRALDVMGNRFVQIYGQGESPMTITALSRRHLADRAHPRWEARAASVGVAQSLVEVRVVDAEGRPLPAGETGEVVVRGDSVMLGYWRDTENTAKTLRDGWLWTGDLGAFDEDGFLTLKDRSKDVIISGGANIYPREVEEVLLKHPKVREVSVVGRKDAEWGEVAVAFVVGEGVTPEELDALCLECIARFKRPKEYRFVESLPKNNYGKVLKTVLREQL